MPSPFQGFATRMLTGSVLGEVMKMLPEPAREALADVRDYVAEHGRFPKLQPLKRGPIGPEGAQAVNVLLAPIAQGEVAKMVNLWKGTLDGGTLRGCNVAIGEIRAGQLSGGNAFIGDVRGGLVERVNLIVGDVHGGEIRTAAVVIGDVHGGTVQCNVFIGDVHGGKVIAKRASGEAKGGELKAETKL